MPLVHLRIEWCVLHAHTKTIIAKSTPVAALLGVVGQEVPIDGGRKLIGPHSTRLDAEICLERVQPKIEAACGEELRAGEKIYHDFKIIRILLDDDGPYQLQWRGPKPEGV